MSNKLTNNELEQMILEVLQEQQKLDEISIRVKGRGKVKDNEIEKKLKISGFSVDDYKDFAKTQSDTNVIDDKDTKKALTYKSTSSPYGTRKKIAKAIKAAQGSKKTTKKTTKKTVDPKVKAALKAYTTLLGKASAITDFEFPKNIAKPTNKSTEADIKKYNKLIQINLDEFKRMTAVYDTIVKNPALIQIDQTRKGSLTGKTIKGLNLTTLNKYERHLALTTAEKKNYKVLRNEIRIYKEKVAKVEERLHNTKEKKKVFIDKYTKPTDITTITSATFSPSSKKSFFKKKLDSVNVQSINYFLTNDATELTQNNVKVKISQFTIFQDAITAIIKGSDELDDKIYKKLLTMHKIILIFNKRETNALQNKTYIDDTEVEKIQTNIVGKWKAFLGKTDPISAETTGLDIKSLKTSTDIGQDVFSNVVLKYPDGMTPDSDQQKAFIDMITNELGNLITENVTVGFDPEDIFDMLQKDASKADTLRTKIKSLYKSIRDGSLPTIGTTTGFDDEHKRVYLKYLKDLHDAVDYYASGRQTRTKRGATTGWTVGTAQTSGTSRLDQELESMMFKSGGGNANSTAAQRLKHYGQFLTNVNTSLSDDTDLTGDIGKLFSQFVGLEILNDNLFSFEEETVKGNIFEAFLSLICGGSQMGALRGGADYSYKSGGNTIQGSAKLVNKSSFSQSLDNLKQPLEYVIAIKGSKTKSGQRIGKPETGRLSFVDIHVIMVNPTGTPNSTTGRYKNYILSGGTTTDTVSPKIVDNQAVFDPSDTILSASYVTTFDFSFLQDREFSDISSSILSKINKQVEQAFGALTNLRDNITRWIDDKDLIAANQVSYNQKDLSSAIEGLEKHDDYKKDKLKEANMRTLDSLIAEAIKDIKRKRKK